MKKTKMNGVRDHFVEKRGIRRKKDWCEFRMFRVTIS